MPSHLQFLWIAGYLKRSNDAAKLNIYKYTNFNIIVIYINRLSPATQIFIALDYLILKSEKYLCFGKKHVARMFFIRVSQRYIQKPDRK